MGSRTRLPGLLYADDLVLRGESKEDLRKWWDSLLRCVGEEDKVRAGKNKMMVLNGEDGLECEVYVDGFRLEHYQNLNIWDV